MAASQRRRAGARTGSRELIGLAGQISADDSEAPGAAQGAAIDWNRYFVSIYDGQRCCGHLIASRGKRWRAVDASDGDLGEFADRESARRAVVAAGRAP